MHLNERQREVTRRYADLTLSRHTSYPAVPFWREFSEAKHRSSLERSNDVGADLSLYVHVPFCERLCYYCTCTKQVMPRREDGRWRVATDSFVDGLEREMIRVAACVRGGRVVRQIHLGGGTPTYLTNAQLAQVMAVIRRQFEVAADAEASIELDPRVTTPELLVALRELGFNRVSLGVQDFDARVQAAVNRVQPLELVANCVDACRRIGFDSVNFDLIYGLPQQTVSTHADTIRKTIALEPDRVALYRMAVMPELFRWQNVFRADDLPTSDATCEMFLNAVDAFTWAGYQFVGLDHFARPTDALSRAEASSTLRRTFQGVTTGAGLDVLGFGPSAISILGDAYAQNCKATADWEAAISLGGLAICRGVELSRDDVIRRAVIEHIYCHATIDKTAIEQRFAIRFDDYFDAELARLAALQRDGLVQLTRSSVQATFPLGRLLLRVIAALFDAYLPPEALRPGSSIALASKVG